MNQPTIPADVRERIVAVADQLYQEVERERFPTVDQVRRAAKVNMNDASAIMKEWRRAQTAQAAPVAIQVPEAIQQANAAAVATLWQQAQELANESLRAAQAGWEAERGELDAMRQELAEAYETQARELDQVEVRAAAVEQAAQEAAKRAADEIGAVRTELVQALTRAERAEAKADEIERRATDLRTELDHAHREQERLAAAAEADRSRVASVIQERDRLAAEVANLSAKLDTERDSHQEQRKISAQEAHRATERLTKAQAERDEGRMVASTAREEAAALRGEIDALRQQLASQQELLRGLAGPKGDGKADRRK
ncbi:DNA-binding protein [Shewanella indica]|uniref:DNA-binding protein n=1 Tax=Shewanella indica TaxID=768528 RepID=A0ABU4QJ79_9GAMM|nr:DNA-binding protein [Shewanella indica]MDX6018620.1 DNA-binding protein [Shewanella indica]MDX6018653.1 DNA-binding protein [Shewanella indica]